MFKVLSELKRINENLKKQGKSEEEIRRVLGAYLDESKRKINPNGDFEM